MSGIHTQKRALLSKVKHFASSHLITAAMWQQTVPDPKSWLVMADFVFYFTLFLFSLFYTHVRRGEGLGREGEGGRGEKLGGEGVISRYPN